jgi:glycosyltransferase involved in cell wall biosynthesis
MGEAEILFRRPAPQGQTPVRKRTAVVCQLLHALGMGGAEVLAARLARQLGDTYRFLFVCLDGLGTLGEELRGDGFSVRVLGRKPGVDWSCLRRLADLLRRERVDLIHAHQYTPFFYALAARLLYRRPAVLFTEHGRHYPDYPRRKRIVANRLLLQRRDRLVGVGQSVRQALIDNEGLPAGRVEVIYNGMDLSAYSGRGADRQAVRRELGVGPDDVVILQVARLDYLKDHATAVRMMAQVVKCRADVRLLVVGEGPERPGIEELVRQLNVGDQVRLLGLRSDVARLLGAADLCLLTSISEGIPLTVIEAMAAGLPVVATRVGGLGEMIDDGVHGLLAPAGDPAALAACVLRLAGDPGLRAALGRAGRGRAEATFSEGRMHEQYLGLYREMLCG